MGSDTGAGQAQSDAPGAVATPPIGIPAWRCQWDSCAILTPRQKRFASARCRAAWHDALHPRLDVDPSGFRAGSIRSLLLGILTDGAWHTGYDLALKLHADKHSVMARLSELRKRGHVIEADLRDGNSLRPHRFRLVK